MGLIKMVIDDAVAGKFAAIWFCTSVVMLALLLAGLGIYHLIEG